MRVVAIVVSLAITAIAVALAVIAVRDMLRVIRSGKPVVGRKDNPGARWKNMFVETLGHTRMLQLRWVGIMHWFVMLGFIFLSSMVFGAYLQIFDAHQALPIIGHWRVYEWPAELLSWLTLIGISYLIFVRQKNHPRRLDRKSRFFGSTFWQAYFVESVILAVVVCGFALRSLEYAMLNTSDYLTEHPDAAGQGDVSHFPLTFFFGELWGGLSLSTLETLVYAIAMIKIVISMTWLIVIARNIAMGVAWHRFTAWFNIWFKRNSSGATSLGTLQPIYIKGVRLDLENMDDLEEEDFANLGVGKVEDFNWKGILDFTTCTECGRCQDQCPAWNTEKPLSPKLLVLGLRDHAYAKADYVQTPEGERDGLSEELVKEGERPLVGDESMYGVIDPDVLWSCTSCGACVQQCPVDIEHVDHIMDMRRYQVIVESNFPSELNNIFKGLERKGNPWGMDPKNRMDWAKNLDFEVKQVGVDVDDLDEVEWLFWVGCAGAYEDRAKKTTAAVAELLDMAGVTFAVLGDGETCTGDSARRAGNEILFQQLGMQNSEVLTEMKAKKVVSACAHCFNTLKNEYKEFGLDLEVVHHTQLLNRLVREGKLTPVAPTSGAAAGKSITYHDPCFLGRHNQVYEPPRELLDVIPGATFTEMPRNSEKSFCCGAGGARMWMEENIGSRINVNRTEEAVATGADQIAVGCPFCRIMLSDGLTLKQSEGEAREEVEVLDVAQLLLESVRRSKTPEEGEEASVVAEAEAATSGAVSDATADEPSAAEEDNPATVSNTEDVGDAAKATVTGPDADIPDGQPMEELDNPQTEGDGVNEADKDVAAKHNVDDEGSRVDNQTGSNKPAEPTAQNGDDGPETVPAHDEPVSDESVPDESVNIEESGDAPAPDEVHRDTSPVEEIIADDDEPPVDGDARDEEAETVDPDKKD